MEFDKDKQQEALKMAKGLAKDFDEAKAKEFATKHKGAKWYDDFILLYEMIRDKDFQLDTKTYLTIAGAIAYVVLPADVIPDFIPIVGWIDDTFVLKMVIDSISEEIDRYKFHKMKKR